MSDSRRKSNNEMSKTKPVSRRSVEKALRQSETTHTPSIESRRARAAQVEHTAETKVPSRSRKSQPISPNQTVHPGTTSSKASRSAAAPSRNAAKQSGQEQGAERRGGSKDMKNMSKQDRKKMKAQKRREKRTAGRTFMNILMVTYVVVGAIVGTWGIKQFFWFYVQEKSPVMAAGTSNSRVSNTPDFSEAQMSSAKEAIMGSGFAIKDVTIRQVGPTVHFYIVANDDLDRGGAHTVGNQVITKFAEVVEKPDVFGTYEAQIIVSKDTLEKPSDEVMLRPAVDDGNEQPFPQYGVSNAKTGGAERNISWTRNGD